VKPYTLDQKTTVKRKRALPTQTIRWLLSLLGKVIFQPGGGKVRNSHNKLELESSVR